MKCSVKLVTRKKEHSSPVETEGDIGLLKTFPWEGIAFTVFQLFLAIRALFEKEVRTYDVHKALVVTRPTDDGISYYVLVTLFFVFAALGAAYTFWRFERRRR